MELTLNPDSVTFSWVLPEPLEDGSTMVRRTIYTVPELDAFFGLQERDTSEYTEALAHIQAIPAPEPEPVPEPTPEPDQDEEAEALVDQLLANKLALAALLSRLGG